MNVPLIQMPASQAREKLHAYRAQLRQRADVEYEQAAAGYQALAKGTPLINLSEAIAVAGVRDDLRPCLAIARADRQQVFVRVESQRLVYSTLGDSWRRYNGGSLRVAIGFEHPAPKQLATRPGGSISGWALVPMVPADVRPRVDLRGCFVLWEVATWADRPLRMQPDRDPYLLRYLGGDLYAVIAEWELTDLERAIMAGRRQ